MASLDSLRIRRSSLRTVASTSRSLPRVVRVGVLLVVTLPLACRSSARREVQILDYGPRAPVKAGASVGQDEGVPAAEHARTAATETLSGPQEPSKARPADGRFGLPVHGFLQLQYRGRWASDDSDHDLYATTYVDIGDPAKDPYTGRLSASLVLNDRADSVFTGVNDTYDGSLIGYLYEAFVDANEAGPFEVIRLGRQQMWDVPTFVWFDGLLLKSEPLTSQGLRLGAYGGFSHDQFDSAYGEGLVAGAYAEARPWSGGRPRLDWQWFHDSRLVGDGDYSLVTLGLVQGIGRGLELAGSYSLLESDSRDYDVRATYRSPESGLLVQASYYELLQAQKELPLEIDPFFDSLRDLFPYHQARLLVSRSWTEFRLDGGFDIRRVEDDDDVGRFNRDYERYYLTGTLVDVVSKGWDLGLTGDVFDNDGSSIQTWGADLTGEITERLDASVGSYFSLYEDDQILQSGHERVRDYYLRMRFEQTEDLSFDLRYQFGDDQIDEFHTLRLGLTWAF